MAAFARRLFNAGQERISSYAARSALNRAITAFLPAALPGSPAAEGLHLDLVEQGCVFTPPLLPEEELHGLREELAARPCFDAWRRHLGEFALVDAPYGTNNAHIVGVREISAALRLANHPLVLEVVSKYLGCKPTIDDVLAWWSISGRPAPIEEQYFHRDRDAIRFIKLFVYLSDVGPEDGSHVFVLGSHRANKLLHVRRRYEDAEVLREFPAAAVKRITGAFGTCFLEDTFGLHKGEVPQGRRPRLLFQVRYTSLPSNFAMRRAAAVQSPREFDSYTNRFLY